MHRRSPLPATFATLKPDTQMDRLYTPSKKCSKEDLFRWLRWDFSDQRKLESYDLLRKAAAEAWKQEYKASKLDLCASTLERRRQIGPRGISNTGNAMRAVIQIVPEQERLMLRASKPLMMHLLYHSWMEFRDGRKARKTRRSAKQSSPINAEKASQTM
ncbi:MAG: hypothetical protein Q9200_001441 [Gallowayella weberi]